MDWYIRIKATECKYQEYDRRLGEQFINSPNDKNITAEKIKELTALKDTSGVSSEQVLISAQRVEVQRLQKAVLDNIRDFDLIRRNRKKTGEIDSKETTKDKKWIENCSYCGTTHLQKQCPADSKTCSKCGMVNTFKEVCRSAQRQ